MAPNPINDGELSIDIDKEIVETVIYRLYYTSWVVQYLMTIFVDGIKIWVTLPYS